MNLELDGKVAIVTGGSSGIGLAITEAFVREGARVVVADRDPCPLAGDAVHCVNGDLGDDAFPRRVVEQALQRFGSVDALVNNAGCNDGVGVQAGPDAFAKSVLANLQHYYAMVHCARESLAKARGAIVNIGSKVAVTGQGGTSGYAAAKGGVMALTREWALDFCSDGVRVNAVLPAEVYTPLYERWLAAQTDPQAERARIEASIPLQRRFTTPREIADTVVFVASPRSSHTTGQILYVDGGYTHLDRRATS